MPHAGDGPAGFAGRRRGQGRVHADEAVKAAAPASAVILVRNETDPDDIHGMDAAAGHPDRVGGMTRHAAVVARGMGSPAWWARATRDRRRSAEAVRRGRRHGEGRRLDLARWLHGARVPGPGATHRARDDAASSRRSWSGRTSYRGARRARQRRHPARRQEGARASAPRASACAAPSTCSSPRTGCPTWCSMILAASARRTRRRARGQARRARSRDQPQGHGRAAQAKSPRSPSG